MKRIQDNQQGYTVLELLAVILIVVILAAIIFWR
jgi:prepilin-type N-terminal cleavage/methylation domain-containing protein